MQFVGPATLYIQSKNINDFYAIIRNNSETTIEKAGVGAALFAGLMNFGTKGGKAKKKSETKK